MSTEQDLEKPEGINTEEEQEKKSVALEDFERMKKDMLKYKDLARQYESEKKRSEEQQLEKNNEWQRLAEARKQEIDSLQQKYEGIKTSIVRNTKFDALKAEAVKMGLRQEAIDDLERLDYDEKLPIETTNTGRYSVLGVENYLQELKSKKPHWFKTANNSFNSDLPDLKDGHNTNSSEITVKTLIELENKYKKSRDAKDLAAYEAAFKKYQRR